MKILAFDQATTKTGYALLEEGKVTCGLINLGVKEFKKLDADIKGRLTVKKISELIGEFQPDIVIIEDVALQKNAKVLIQLSRIQGGIIGYCDSIGMPIAVMKPSQWRKICLLTQGAGVKRSELKTEAKKFVESFFNLKVSSDEADAICIAWAGYVEAKSLKNKEDKNDEKV